MAVIAMSDQDRVARAIESLRMFLRDKPALNKLLLGQAESSDAELTQCLGIAITDWNRTPPPLAAVTLKTHPNKFLLLEKAAIEAIKQAMLWHAREHMPGSDGGTSGDDHAKAAEYSGIIERLEAEYERKKIDEKVSLNIRAAYGHMSVSSEYGCLGTGVPLYGLSW